MMHINKERLIKTFCDLATIISPSGQEQEISDFIIKKLENLGLPTQKDSYGNIIAKLNGNGEPIMICAHMDTVAIGGDIITPIKKNNIIMSDGTTILGADNKDSIAAILEATETIKEKGLKNQAIEIVFTKEEELISRGAQNLDYALISSKKCIIADLEAPYGTIITKAPYLYQFNIKIQGKRAHSKEPETGINTAFIIAKTINLMPLGMIDSSTIDQTTVNVSFLQAGLSGKNGGFENHLTAGRNIIPDLGIIQGEIRGFNLKKIEQVKKKIREVLENTTKEVCGKYSCDFKHLADGYVLCDKLEFIKSINKIFSSQSTSLVLKSSVGGSDANIFNQKGIESIVIGSAYHNAHKKEEYLDIEEVVLLAEFYVKLMSGIE